MRKIFIASAYAILASIGPASAQDAADPSLSGTPLVHVISPIPIYCALVAVAALTTVLFVYAWGLRDRTANMAAANAAATTGGNTALADFNGLPMGLPRGTVRAILALIIVFGSVVFLAISLMGGTDYKFPETLSGILGAILGFYFGKSASGDDGSAVTAVTAANADAKQARDVAASATSDAQAAQDAASKVQAQMDQVTQDKNQLQATTNSLAGDKLDGIQGGLQQAADFGKTLASALPGAAGRDIGAAADGLLGTVAAVNSLRSGDLPGAVQKATDLVAAAAPNLPLVQLLGFAAKAIGPVLGGAFPPLALITTIVSLGSKLSAAGYARWVARVMDEPYTQAQFSPATIDSTLAASLAAGVPAMAKALAGPLQALDHDTVLKVVRAALTEDGATTLSQQFPDLFSAMAQPALDSAVRDLQKAALDSVLIKNDLPGQPDAPKLLQAVDAIRADRDASAALDMVMTAVTQLKGAGQHPETAFMDARNKLEKADAAPKLAAAA